MNRTTIANLFRALAAEFETPEGADNAGPPFTEAPPPAPVAETPQKQTRRRKVAPATDPVGAPEASAAAPPPTPTAPAAPTASVAPPPAPAAPGDVTRDKLSHKLLECGSKFGLGYVGQLKVHFGVEDVRTAQLAQVEAFLAHVEGIL